MTAINLDRKQSSVQSKSGNKLWLTGLRIMRRTYKHYSDGDKKTVFVMKVKSDCLLIQSPASQIEFPEKSYLVQVRLELGLILTPVCRVVSISIQQNSLSLLTFHSSQFYIQQIQVAKVFYWTACSYY